MRVTTGSIAVVNATPSFAMPFYTPTMPGVHGAAERTLVLWAKRAVDVVLAATCLLLSLPLLLLASAAISLTTRGAPFFRQRRVGLNGAEFTMYKLRTMCDDAELQEAALAERRPHRVFFKRVRDPRVTAVGKWLRKYSIDELPQLYNVLIGDMSLVGPRPLLASDWKNFPRDHHRRRITMKPGITGLWQVNGRSLCSDQERMRLDVEYVDRWTFAMDIKILLRTPAVVLSARGAC